MYIGVVVQLVHITRNRVIEITDLLLGLQEVYVQYKRTQCLHWLSEIDETYEKLRLDLKEDENEIPTLKLILLVGLVQQNPTANNQVLRKHENSWAILNASIRGEWNIYEEEELYDNQAIKKKFTNNPYLSCKITVQSRYNVICLCKLMRIQY